MHSSPECMDGRQAVRSATVIGQLGKNAAFEP
jgi:hypothetical protein